jgi:hypothetical protein
MLWLEKRAPESECRVQFSVGLCGGVEMIVSILPSSTQSEKSVPYFLANVYGGNRPLKILCKDGRRKVLYLYWCLLLCVAGVVTSLQDRNTWNTFPG